MRLIKDIKKMGKDSNGKIVAIFDLLCDTESDLPATNQYSSDGYVICQGSRAYVIGSATRYMMQSSGTWTIQSAGAAAYTKAEIDAMMQRQEAEIGVVANAGAKNNFNIASPDAIDYKTTHNISDDSVTIIGSAGFSRYVVPVSLKAGSYIFTANVNSISTSGRVRFNTASDGTGTNVTSQIDFSQAGSISRDFNIAQDTSFFVMIYSSTSSADTSSSLVISQCMIRPASITNSFFVPYAPTNRELYEMILAL